MAFQSGLDRRTGIVSSGVAVRVTVCPIAVPIRFSPKSNAISVFVSSIVIHVPSVRMLSGRPRESGAGRPVDAPGLAVAAGCADRVRQSDRSGPSAFRCVERGQCLRLFQIASW